MNRNYKKLVDAYKKKFYNAPASCRRGMLWTNDYVSVYDLAAKQPNNIIFSCIDISLKAGIMIGYNAAKAEEKEKRQKKER